MIANGLRNLAMDQEVLYEHLNLRVLAHDFDEAFEPAPYTPPVPPYSGLVASQMQAADLVETIARNSALFVVYLGGAPAEPVAFDGELDDPDLLRLIIDWGTVQIGVQRAIIELYGEQPVPPAGLPHAGAASEERLWAEIVAWLTKIAADSDRVIEVQHIEDGAAPEENAPSPLARMEQGAQRIALNMLRTTGLLPYHLYHAGHPAEPDASLASSQQSGRGGRKRKKRGSRRR
jgi:hypothetical protein